MKLLRLVPLIFLCCAEALSIPVNVQKTDSLNNTLTGNVVAGNGVSITATGTGTIVATSAPAGGITGIVSGLNGGTGVANQGAITIGGNLTTVGAFPLTFNIAGNTSIALPTSGTLLTTTGDAAQLTNSALTVGRVPFAGSAGKLMDSSALTFNSGTGALSATSFVGAGTSLTGIPYSVSNISSLRSVNSTVLLNGTQIFVSGYASPNGVGGGGYAWDASNTLDDNFGTVIKPTTAGASGRFIFLGPQAIINVQTFGAVGDGNTDDTTAINHAFSAAVLATLGGNTVVTLYFPRGTYQYSGTMTYQAGQFYIRGDGKSLSIINHTPISPNTDLLVFSNTSSSYNTFNRLSDITLESSSSNSRYLLDVEDQNHFVAQNFYIHGGLTGLRINNSISGLYTDCVINTTSSNCVILGDSTTHGHNTTQTIRNAYIGPSSGAGIYQADGDVWLQSSIIESCSNYGAYIATGKAVLISNHFEENSNGCVKAGDTFPSNTYTFIDSVGNELFGLTPTSNYPTFDLNYAVLHSTSDYPTAATWFVRQTSNTKRVVLNGNPVQPSTSIAINNGDNGNITGHFGASSDGLETASLGGSSFTPDTQEQSTFLVTLSANTTVNAPAFSAVKGELLRLIFVQPSGGGKSITWNSAYKISWSDLGNLDGTVSSASFIFDGTNWRCTSCMPWAPITGSASKSYLTSLTVGTIISDSGNATISVAGAPDTTFTNNPRIDTIYSTTGYAVGNGAGIGLGGQYNSGGSTTSFGYIGAVKENSTDGNYSGLLRLGARQSGAGAGDMTILTLTGSTRAASFTGNVSTGGALSVTGAATATGNVSLTTAGSTLLIKSGTNAASGTVTLVAGNATITSTAIDANTVIIFSEKTAGGTPGIYQPLAAVSAGNATVTSAPTDTSTYNWIALKVN